MIRLIIKGTLDQAKKAARERCIPLLNIQERHVFLSGEAVADCEEEHRLSCIRWFCERITCSPGQGFPPGTLLHYAPDDSEG